LRIVTSAIIHLEHANKQQDFDLMERAAVIASLEQQVQMLQLLVLPVPAVEPDAVSDVDEALVGMSLDVASTDLFLF
jgi:hypothetical protein